MMQLMHGLLRNLTNNLYSWSAVFLLWVLGGCHKRHAQTSLPPYVIKHVEASTVDLPVMIIDTPHGRKKVHPAVWNAKTLKFSDGIPQKIKVKKGDSLFSLSNKYAIPLPMIIEKNHLIPPFSLHPGQDLILLGPKVHIVQEGEDFYKISDMHKVSLRSLMRLNNLSPKKPLKVGYKLILPAPQAIPIALDAKKWHLSQGSETLIKPAVPTSPFKIHSVLRENSVPRSDLKFQFPLKGDLLSKFGPKGQGLYNDGINIGAPQGSKIIASESGTVVYRGNDIKSYGNLILVKHRNGWMSAYAHLDKIMVQKGQAVRQKDVLGIVGSSGRVKEPQLHFELRKDGKPQDPLTHLK